MRLGITGASGFVGNTLRQRAETDGWDVVSTVRIGSGIRGSVGSVRMVDDPWSSGAWADVFADVDCVVHLIGRAHHADEGAEAEDLYRRDNVFLSQALMEGIARTTVAKVVYLSSIKAVAEQTIGVPINGATIPFPTTPYGKTKLEAEERFVDWAAVTSTHLVVLRPPLVYGPGVKGNFRSLLRIADSLIPLPIGSIENKRSMISLDNLCDVILTSAREDIRGIYRLPVADEDVLSTPEVITVLRATMGRPRGLVRFPERMLTAVSRAVGFEGQFRRISDDLVIDSQTAEIELGWTPPDSAIEGLIQTALWYASRTG